MYLVDTNVISEVRKRDRCDARVAAWYRGVEGEDLHLSVLVIGEIRRGLQKLVERDPAQSAALESWFVALRTAFAGRILPVDEEVAEAWGVMNALRTCPLFDGVLAATASVHGLILVTRNTKDVAGTGVKVLNPFVDRRVRTAR